MLNEVFKAQIGHGESAVVEPKGFWPGRYPVVVTLLDEPGNRRLVVTIGRERLEVALPIPTDSAS